MLTNTLGSAKLDTDKRPLGKTLKLAVVTKFLMEELCSLFTH